ncbi:hypothetical protein DPEC_G00199890 [Dallia pectoralis]|uniref:Uncharacterized protein n=1 Tax=Dallia pectoralis TaxID=75939 RepID=A0ACC2G909_DALPE|nr:hypothetical protein DPEC_G00199890 [Dallia pectoralis]
MHETTCTIPDQFKSTCLHDGIIYNPVHYFRSEVIDLNQAIEQSTVYYYGIHHQCTALPPGPENSPSPGSGSDLRRLPSHPWAEHLHIITPGMRAQVTVSGAGVRTPAIKGPFRTFRRRPAPRRL